MFAQENRQRLHLDGHFPVKKVQLRVIVAIWRYFPIITFALNHKMTTNEKVESAGFVWRSRAGALLIQPFSFSNTASPLF